MSQITESLLLGAAIAAAAMGWSCTPSRDPGSLPNQFLDTTCRAHSDGVLIPRTRCGHCGQPEASDMRAVHANVVDRVRRRACDKNLHGCPACFTYPDPSLLARCVQGACVAVDLGRTSVVHGSKDEDCKFRAASCCECNTSSEPPPLVAIASSREAVGEGNYEFIEPYDLYDDEADDEPIEED